LAAIRSQPLLPRRRGPREIPRPRVARRRGLQSFFSASLCCRACGKLRLLRHFARHHQTGRHSLHPQNGAFRKKYLPETMGPGVAFIDYDNDGYPDIFLVNGMDWPGHVKARSTPKLYHNNHDGTFTDVTRKAGLDVELYGLGVAVGDYDNDGFD